jgi:hypothetical protein
MDWSGEGRAGDDGIGPRQTSRSIVGGLAGVCRQRLGGCNLQLLPAKVVAPNDDFGWLRHRQRVAEKQFPLEITALHSAVSPPIKQLRMLEITLCLQTKPKLATTIEASQIVDSFRFITGY